MTNGMISIGILGLGGIGATHARALRSLAHNGSAVRVAAFSGGSAQLATECGWPEARQLSPAELIAADGVDVITICTPSAGHADQAMTSLRSGKHVVVEKPMALSTEDAVAVRVTAAELGLTVSPMAQRRFEPLNIELKQLISSGSLDRIVLGETFVHWFRPDDYYRQAPWRGERAGGGGSLMNQGLHNVDLLCWLMGGVSSVAAHSTTLGHEIGVEDTTTASLQFSNGALGVIVTTTATPPGVPAELSLWTTAGAIRIDQDGIQGWTVSGVPRPADPEVVVSGASDPAAIGISGHVAQWQDVLSALTSGTAPSITADDGVATVAVLDGIYRSAATGKTVDVGSFAGADRWGMVAR